MRFSPNDFIHPEDKAAREHLEGIPGFGAALKAFMKFYQEQLFHGLNMAQKIRLGPQQLPNLYSILPPICQQLGINEPEFYLEMNPVPNAYTYGDTHTFITIDSGIVQALQPDELRAVVAHECGHIVCRHTLYRTMADLLLQLGGGFLGTLAAVAAKPIQLGLLYWSRRSELSADRAAAVIMGGAEPVIQTMIRLAGGPCELTGKVNVDLYLEQAKAYDKLQESAWDKILQGMSVMNQSHPFLAVRAREIHLWCQTDHFQRVMEAAKEARWTCRCPSCGQPVQENWKFCSHCGAANQQAKHTGTKGDQA